MLGEATLANTGGTACSLPRTTPRVRILSSGRILPVRQVSGMAVSGETPVYVLAPGAKAAIYLQWREWCGQPPETTTIRPVFQIRFGGLAIKARAQAMSPPRCDAPGSGTAASTLAVSRPLTY